jgi:hypothetical protein
MEKNRSPRPASARAGSFLGVMCLWIALAPLAATAAPKLTTPVLRKEIGELTAGESAEAAFPLTNAGADPLQIVEVKTNCGCTTTSHPQSLKPGETGILKVTLRTDPLWNGPVEKQITVISNDPEQPAFKMHLAANVKPLFRFDPSPQITVPYKKGDVIRRVVIITSLTDPPVAISGVAVQRIVGLVPNAGSPTGVAELGTGEPETTARLLPAEGATPPGTTRVEITVRPPKQGGNFVTMLALQTTHPRVPSLSITIAGVSEDTITVVPPVLYMGLPSAASPDPLGSILLLKQAGGFRVRDVTTDSPVLKTEVSEAIAGEAYQINVYYQGGWPAGKKTGSITITTDLPGSPKVVVPYEATVK